ncbi:cob(I)yrinic acid a,c-diamide adenosyltransferase [Natrialba taiwanensis]|uniref:ATP:corrinoid adenosyltransferase BtuR/CobO/CobP n=1 Tax=Natrialba taiwanensis DSM 12281 TaxID=1230458 RepID=L9ZGQ7_9EURY|nr:cob(I)yrinic acid a,c-diamide adenosyltransferase [Natrialba taiwanensis]ELY84797.1 ATP:corrinoid adenosyltransferase BtuR/CobO/CobP [Natrialba taiwanensis DSM 12281]
MYGRVDGWDMSEDRTPETTDTPESVASSETVIENTPGQGRTPEAERIEPAAPEEFGLVQVWWGDGKGKTTATLGMGMRAAGHGYRVHVLQFMKGGASSVEAVRGEYNAIDALPGMSYENLGHYGWHGMADGSDEAQHEAEAQAGLERAREVLTAASEADLGAPLDLDGDPVDGVHMLVLDEVLYAVERDLFSADDVHDLLDAKPADLELVLSGGHDEPTYLEERADLITNVRKEKHPIEDGQRARRGTEF